MFYFSLQFPIYESFLLLCRMSFLLPFTPNPHPFKFCPSGSKVPLRSFPPWLQPELGVTTCKKNVQFLAQGLSQPEGWLKVLFLSVLGNVICSDCAFSPSSLLKSQRWIGMCKNNITLQMVLNPLSCLNLNHYLLITTFMVDGKLPWNLRGHLTQVRSSSLVEIYWNILEGKKRSTKTKARGSVSPSEGK